MIHTMQNRIDETVEYVEKAIHLNAISELQFEIYESNKLCTVNVNPYLQNDIEQMLTDKMITVEQLQATALEVDGFYNDAIVSLYLNKLKTKMMLAAIIDKNISNESK